MDSDLPDNFRNQITASLQTIYNNTMNNVDNKVSVFNETLKQSFPHGKTVQRRVKRIKHIHVRDRFKQKGDHQQYKIWRNKTLILIRKTKSIHYHSIIYEARGKTNHLWCQEPREF